MSQTGGSRRGSGAGTPLQTGAREQMVRTQDSGRNATPQSRRGPSPRVAGSPAVGANAERTASRGSGYGIHHGDPLAEPPRQADHSDSARDAPPTRMSNKSQMSDVSYGRMQQTGFTDTGTGGDDEMMPPRRTLRRMYEDQSHYQKDEFLHGIEPAPSFWKPEATTRNTIFHQGFYRGIVTGQDAIRREHEQGREERSMWREQPRNERLTGLTKHHFLREDPPAKGNGRRHFQEASNIMIRGPERCVSLRK
jgi:hypothetical protein